MSGASSFCAEHDLPVLSPLFRSSSGTYPGPMIVTPNPPIGLIGLAQSGGEVGKLIRAAEWLYTRPYKDWLSPDNEPPWEHAFVSIGQGLIVEAEPGGARVAHASDHPGAYWCYGIYKLLVPGQACLVEDAAKKYVGVPYSFLDYAALIAHRLHAPVPGLRQYIASTGHMICSQLADQCYTDAHANIFTDHRWPGYISPMDLYLRDCELV